MQLKKRQADCTGLGGTLKSFTRSDGNNQSNEKNKQKSSRLLDPNKDVVLNINSESAESKIKREDQKDQIQDPILGDSEKSNNRQVKPEHTSDFARQNSIKS